MDILKAFSLLNTEYPVNIQGTLENPLFQANQIGKLLGIKNVNQNLSDFGEKYKVIYSTYSLGGIQETTFLTEFGLYKLLGRSRKDIASKFQNWIVEILREIRITGMYKLQQDKDIDKKLIQYNCAVINHNTLLKAYYKKSVVYVCKMKDNLEENKFVIKIGSTQNIKERMNNLSNSYNAVEPLLLDIFESDEHIKFERFLHKHEFIKNYKYSFEIKNGEISTETYLINIEQYNEIIKIMTDSKLNFQNNTGKETEEIRLKTEELRNENEKLILKQKELDIEIEKLSLRKKEIELEMFNLNKQELLKISDENKIILLEKEKEVNQETEEEKKDTISYSYKIKERKYSAHTPKVYQYNPNDLSTPINIFEAPSEVERKISDISPGPLKNASKNNTIYKGYRWAFINRNDSPPEKLEPTIDNKNKTTDVQFVAMIDIKKTKIMAVYSNQKEATLARNMKCNSFNRAINQDTVSSGHYWNYFYKCSKEMQNDFLSHSKLPEKYVSQCGKKVQQIDPKTNKVLNTYSSNREVVKLFQIASSTLKKISQTGDIHNGFIWKIV